MGGSINVASSIVVPPITVTVTFDGVRRSDIYCTSVSLGMGTAGSTAALLIPSLAWDGGKSALRGAQVVVRAGYGTPATIFVGWVRSATGRIAGNMIEVEAASLLALGDTVYIGQERGGDLVVEYPQQALDGVVLRDTDWSVASILRDWFGTVALTWRGGGGSLPSQWRAILKLGPLTTLGTQWNTFPIGDQVFRQATLREALDQLLGIVGTISIRERFEGTTTYLDFFELGDPGAPLREVRVARAGEPIAGTNVLTIDHEETCDDIRTRLIGLGAPELYIVSITSDHETAPLEPDWDDELEAAVLANPEGTKRGAETPGGAARTEFDEARALVFRRWRLPECIRRRVVARDLGISLADGRPMPIQVWKLPRVLAWDEEEEEWTSELAAAPTILEGTQFDLEAGTITLKRPAINMVAGGVGEGGDIVDSYEAAVVGITIAVEGPRLAHDTGDTLRSVEAQYAQPLGFRELAGAGLTEVIVNDSFRRINYTNIDAAFNDEEFQAWVFWGDEWTHYVAPDVEVDDAEALREFTEAALAEKRRLRASYAITTPYWTGAYRLGDRLRVIGQDDAILDTHQVRSISYALTNDHSTTLATDNGVPMISSELLEGR